MPMVMMGMMGMQAIMGANQAGSQAMQQVTQQNWQNHIGNMQTDQANRDLSAANAAQWMQNNLITEAAYAGWGEENVYLRYNFDNETGELSRRSASVNDQITSALAGKRNKGQSARAILRMQRHNDQKVFEARAISQGNRLRDSERRRDQMLSKRNFGYARHNTFVPAANFIDPQSVHKNALMSGLMKAGMAGYGAAQQQEANIPMQRLMNAQWAHYGGEGTLYDL